MLKVQGSLLLNYNFYTAHQTIGTLLWIYNSITFSKVSSVLVVFIMNGGWITSWCAIVMKTKTFTVSASRRVIQITGN